MMELYSMFRKLLKSEKGATAIEYGLILAVVALAASVGLGQVGTRLNSQMYNTAGQLN
jgi:pilus assembly protein Flp/PilA